MENLEFQTLGKYEVVKRIGRGAAGVVYRARDVDDDTPVALKVTDAQPGGGDRIGTLRYNQFLNEARASAVLEHDNIIKTYEVGEAQGLVYLAMEYVPEARTLDEFCSPDTLLPLEEVVQISLKCAAALDYAHRSGVVHRDIKPRNILLTKDGEVKVADFGIALVTGVDAADTQDQARVGSPLYLSPEQITGRTVTGQSDIFSLGVLMYELLTGRHPFMAELIPAISHNITHKQYVPIRELRRDVPPALERIVDRALKKLPAGRYRTGLDMAGDLNLIFDHIKLEQDGFGNREHFKRIRDLSFFASFPEPEIWEVLNASHWQEFEPGTQIITEGEFGDSFHILVSGEVRVKKGDTQIDVLEKGACFGEIGFVTRKKRMASIIAKNKVTVMEIRAPLIERISVGCQLRFHKAFIDTMSERLLRSMEMNSKPAA